MSTVQIEIPEEVLISLKETPETISRELRILAAVKLFELGKLSSERAAQLAGMSRVEFLMILGHYQVSPFSLTTEQLEQPQVPQLADKIVALMEEEGVALSDLLEGIETERQAIWQEQQQDD